MTRTQLLRAAGSATVLIGALVLAMLDPRNPAWAAGGPIVTLTPVEAVSAPIGVDWYQPTNQLLLSYNYPNGAGGNLELVTPNGTAAPYSTLSGLAGEVYISTIRPSNCQGGFTVGDAYVGNGVAGQIAKIGSGGGPVTNPWVTLPGETGLLRGGLFQDRYCALPGPYAGDLVVTTSSGDVWLVTAALTATEVLTGLAGTLEGPTTVPNLPATYGAVAGTIMAGGEGSSAGCTWSIAPPVPPATTWTSTCYTSFGPDSEGVYVVPSGENFYAVDYGGGRLLEADASQFAGLAGDLVVTTESPGALNDVHWNGSAYVVQQVGAVAQFEGATFAPVPIFSSRTWASCALTGSGTLFPGLTTNGSPGGVKITLRATLSACSSTFAKGTTITGGTLIGNGYYNAPNGGNGSSCANFAGPDIVGKITVKVTWTAIGPVPPPSTIVYKNGTNTAGSTLNGFPNLDTITLPGGAPGTAAKAGSFAVPAAPFTTYAALILVTNLPANAAGGCSAVPFKTFTITGGSISL